MVYANEVSVEWASIQSEMHETKRKLKDFAAMILLDSHSPRLVCLVSLSEAIYFIDDIGLLVKVSRRSKVCPFCLLRNMSYFCCCFKSLP